MKAKGSRRSLSLLKSALCSSIRELEEVCTAIGVDGEANITEFGAKLEWIIREFQALKDLVHQRKEIIPKGKLRMCFKLPTLLRIRMIESELEVIQGSIVSLADKHMEQANNKTSPEMAMFLFPRPTEEIPLNNKEPSIVENCMKLARMMQPKYWTKQSRYKRKLKAITKELSRLDREYDSAATDLKGLGFPETETAATLNLLQRRRQELAQQYCLITSYWAAFCEKDSHFHPTNEERNPMSHV